MHPSTIQKHESRCAVLTKFDQNLTIMARQRKNPYTSTRYRNEKTQQETAVSTMGMCIVPWLSAFISFLILFVFLTNTWKTTLITNRAHLLCLTKTRLSSKLSINPPLIAPTRATKGKKLVDLNPPINRKKVVSYVFLYVWLCVFVKESIVDKLNFFDIFRLFCWIRYNG